MDEESNQPSKVDVPEELQRNLVDAIQAICIFLHEQVKVSHIIVDVKHVSDALAKQSNTMVQAAGLGMPISMGGMGKKTEDNPITDEASKVANEAIERAIKAAKEKGK